MSRQQILSKMCESETYRRITRSICGKQLVNSSGDIHSEIVLRIIEENDPIEELNSLTQYFGAFAYRVINMDYNIAKKYNLPKSKFIPKIDCESQIKSWYDEDGFEINSILLEPDQPYTEDECDKFISQVESVKATPPKSMDEDFKRKLWDIYLKKKSYREVQKATKIPLKMVAKKLQEFKSEIINEIRK